MITFSDKTICDGDGHFASISAIMRDEENLFTWMLRSVASVSVANFIGQPGMIFNYMLHFWDNGNVCIMNTDHPVNINVPDDDIRDLKRWCDDHGWKRLSVHRLLIEDPQGLEFWKRMYIAGLVQSDELIKHEQDEMERLSSMSQIEEDEDADQGQIYVQET
jgi:hypothetical protein